MIPKILTQLGLNESEIKVYFALLELESSTVGPIVDKAKISDSKIYNILEKLKEKGLISFVIKGKYKHFQATDPENLIRILEEKEEEIKQQKEKIQKEIIPMIVQRRKMTEEKQEAWVFEGINGMKSVYQAVLNTMKKGESYRVFHIMDEPLKKKQISLFYKNYHLQRSEKGIFVKFIAHIKEKKTVLEYFNQPFSELRFTDRMFPVGLLIFKGYVLTTVWGDNPTAFLIKSQRNYEYYVKYFDDLWGTAKKGVKNK